MTPPPDPAESEDPLVFTPVPTAAARHDGWTPDRQRAFIATLASHGGVAAAARAVGMTPQTARRLRTRPDAESFARAWVVFSMILLRVSPAEELRAEVITALLMKS